MGIKEYLDFIYPSLPNILPMFYPSYQIYPLYNLQFTIEISPLSICGQQSVIIQNADTHLNKGIQIDIDDM